MPEEVIFETEAEQSRAEIASSLRAVAEKLEGDGAVTLSAGADSVTMEVPERATFEVKAERETSAAGGPGELSIEFELEWREGEASNGELSIE
jgi:amphi-Trp domain-containing protein